MNLKNLEAFFNELNVALAVFKDGIFRSLFLDEKRNISPEDKKAVFLNNLLSSIREGDFFYKNDEFDRIIARFSKSDERSVIGEADKNLSHFYLNGLNFCVAADGEVYRLSAVRIRNDSIYWFLTITDVFLEEKIFLLKDIFSKKEKSGLDVILEKFDDFDFEEKLKESFETLFTKTKAKNGFAFVFVDKIKPEDIKIIIQKKSIKGNIPQEQYPEIVKTLFSADFYFKNKNKNTYIGIPVLDVVGSKDNFKNVFGGVCFSFCREIDNLWFSDTRFLSIMKLWLSLAVMEDKGTINTELVGIILDFSEFF